MFTDAQLIEAFYPTARTTGLKRWEVMFTPIRNTSQQRHGDTQMFFYAKDKNEATRIATEYGMRIKEYRVRYIYLVRGI